MAATAPTAPNLLEVVRKGMGAPLVVMAMLAMVVIPLPTLALDVLFSINISISLLILLAVIYVQRPLEFSSFPTVLLMITMLRLALNVASTRIVLLNGHTGPESAGQVIAAFGEFVIGGNYAVGLIVFAILTIINFIVITKGAGRISEVSARFVLDSLPGKQMAIDADLNAGLLTRDEAKVRRDEVREESDFYGSMDGANKFIRGDAIAGLLILAINLIGGLVIGVLQHDMALADAARTYATLTIGDGLVAQLPSILASTAVAILVSRVSKSQDMSGAVVTQIFGQQRALIVSAAVLTLIGLIPGMPNLAFLTLGAALGGAAWWMARKPAEAGPDLIQQSSDAVTAATKTPELGWDDLAPVDPLGLEVGYRLVPMVDAKTGGELMARIKGVRKKLTQDLGFLIPPVHIRDNLSLSPTSYQVLIHGVPIATGEIHPDREMALNPGQVYGSLDGIPTKDPAFGLDAFWIMPGLRGQAESLGYTVVDAATVIATHISHLVREHAPELLGHDEVQQLLATLAKTTPKLVEDLTPKALPLSTVVRVLQNLLQEKVPIRQLKRIVEALIEHAPQSTDSAVLTSAARTALGRFIVQEINGMSPELPVYTLNPALERVLQDSVNGTGAALEPGLADRLHQGLADCTKRQEALGEPAVLLVPGPVRGLIAKLTRHSVPGLSILAYHEVPEDKRLKLIGAIG